jgi:hypothetical protein
VVDEGFTEVMELERAPSSLLGMELVEQSLEEGEVHLAGGTLHLALHAARTELAAERADVRELDLIDERHARRPRRIEDVVERAIAGAVVIEDDLPRAELFDRGGDRRGTVSCGRLSEIALRFPSGITVPERTDDGFHRRVELDPARHSVIENEPLTSRSPDGAEIRRKRERQRHIGSLSQSGACDSVLFAARVLPEVRSGA